MTSKCITLKSGSELWVSSTSKKLHKEDGPATWNSENGLVGFFLEGKRYTIDEWLDQVDLPANTKTFIYLKYSSRDQYKEK